METSEPSNFKKEDAVLAYKPEFATVVSYGLTRRFSPAPLQLQPLALAAPKISVPPHLASGSFHLPLGQFGVEPTFHFHGADLEEFRRHYSIENTLSGPPSSPNATGKKVVPSSIRLEPFSHSVNYHSLVRTSGKAFVKGAVFCVGAPIPYRCPRGCQYSH